MKSIHKLIQEKINKMPKDEVFTVSDFTDITSIGTASKTLDRLCENKKGINKIFRGVFWKSDDPVMSFQKQPEPAKVAFALARANKWKIAPSGKTAAFLMGLTTEKPKTWTFVSDGTYRNYKLCGFNITFKHTSGKLLTGLSEKTAMLVHAIKEYGEELTPDNLKQWISKLSEKEKKIILSETSSVTDWISKKVKHLLGKEK